MTVKFIADSASDLPCNILEKYDIEVFPLYVHDGDKYYKDGVEMTPDRLYKGMREGKTYKTSQVSVNDFIVRFREYAKNNDKVIYLTLSSALSGTFQSAVLAKKQMISEYSDFDLTIIDSRSASLGIGLAISNTIQDQAKGLDKDEIIEKAKYYSTHMEHIFTVDDLDYLVQGGRLNKVAGFVGGILNIKPIIEIKDGSLVQFEKKKGSRKAMNRIIELIEERGTEISDQTIGIVHADNLEVVEILKDKIEKKTGCSSFVVNTVGAVLGAHVGPGTYGVFFINDKEEINKVEVC